MVDRYLAGGEAIAGDVRGLIAPHAGLMYSGPVAGIGYAALGTAYDVAVLVGPSHYKAFRGVAVADRGAFDTPLGSVVIDEAAAERLVSLGGIVHADAGVHAREHSLELQLPFLCRVLPGVPIVPLLMGQQDRATVAAAAEALAEVFADRRPLFVASSDLSHFHDRDTATRLDAVVLRHVARHDPESLEASLAAFDGHACGGGPMAAVMRAARALGAQHGRVLCYGDSGDVSGDTSQVVGYMSGVTGVWREKDGEQGG
jgi:MEMO1 family protein